MIRLRSQAGLLAVMLLGTCVVAEAWQASPAARQRRAARQADPHNHDGIYQGRPIADVMSFLGAEWLLRDSRIEEEQPDRMLDSLEIKPGMTVADVGAGVGFHSLKLAERVGPGGTVYATDLQPQMLRMLVERAENAEIDNVVPVLCTQTYNGLPANSIDLALMVDVYHEMSDPERGIAGLRRALKPDGRLVLVEFRGEDPEVPIKPEHKMTVAQVRRELEPLGFRLQTLHDFLPWQHILVFEKSDPANPETKPAAAP